LSHSLLSTKSILCTLQPAYGVSACLSVAASVRIIHKLKDRSPSSGSVFLRRLRTFDFIVLGHMSYCFCLGLFTLYQSIHLAWVTGQSSWLKDLSKEQGMAWEEAKELSGITLVLLSLGLLYRLNFVRLKAIGLVFGISLVTFPFVTWVIIQY
jgi:hypothetical protein